MFSKHYVALTREALFTKEMLGLGATEIRKANYAAKGVYFQAFTGLATGLERLGKLCLLIDYYVAHNGSFPDETYLKRQIGHDIVLISRQLALIRERRKLSGRFLYELSDPVHEAILLTLSHFAKGDRYSNIDLLVGSTRQSDPILEWNRSVDKPLFAAHVSEKAKQRIRKDAQLVHELMDGHAFVMHVSETGELIDDIALASELTGVFESVAPLRQLFVLQLIRQWVDTLCSLQHIAMSSEQNDIPYFSEILAGFRAEDSFMKTRKTWPGF